MLAVYSCRSEIYFMGCGHSLVPRPCAFVACSTKLCEFRTASDKRAGPGNEASVDMHAHDHCHIRFFFLCVCAVSKIFPISFSTPLFPPLYFLLLPFPFFILTPLSLPLLPLPSSLPPLSPPPYPLIIHTVVCLSSRTCCIRDLFYGYE